MSNSIQRNDLNVGDLVRWKRTYLQSLPEFLNLTRTSAEARRIAKSRKHQIGIVISVCSKDSYSYEIKWDTNLIKKSAYYQIEKI